MEYREVIEVVVKVVEAVGAAIMVLGTFAGLVVYALAAMKPSTRAGAFGRVRTQVGRSILLGLEVLIVADIVRTIIVDPSFESVAVLGAIVVIRIVLSFSLEVEMFGTWPWRRGPRQ